MSLEVARLALLDLAQSELRALSTSDRRLRAAETLQAAGVGTVWTHRNVATGVYRVRDLLAMALRCTVVCRCQCGVEISGWEWPHLPLVAASSMFESRRCHCGQERVVSIPPVWARDVRPSC